MTDFDFFERNVGFLKKDKAFLKKSLRKFLLDVAKFSQIKTFLRIKSLEIFWKSLVFDSWRHKIGRKCCYFVKIA